MNQLLKTALIVSLCLRVNLLHAQVSIDSIDYSKIDQRKLRELLQNQQKTNIEYFSELKTSVDVRDVLFGYLHFEKEFIVKEDCEIVWDNYLFSNQTDIWDLNRISFGILVDRKTKSIVYANENHVGLQKDQIFFLNLRILNGFYNLPVAFKILSVDPDSKEIIFSYLRGGKASGKQIIRLAGTQDGYTRIVHQSYVKSDSRLRDKYLYPYFHNKLLNEFHANMRKMITRNVRSIQKLLAEKK